MLKGYLFIIASAVIFGTMPLMASWIYAQGVNPMTLVFLRNLLSLPTLGLLAWRQKGSLRVPVKAGLRVGLTGVTGCCITPLLLFAAYKTLPSGTATVFHFIYPAVVALGGLVVFREKKSPRELLAIAVCVVGITLFYDPGQPLDWKGAVLALLSGVTYAAYVLMLSVFQSKQVTGFLFNFWAIFACTLALLPVSLLTGGLQLPTTWAGWGLCLLFATAVNGCAVALFQQGTFRIGGQKAAILSTLEPITGVVLGVLALNETLSLGTGIGTVLVVLASILIASSDLKKK